MLTAPVRNLATGIAALALVGGTAATAVAAGGPALPSVKQKTALSIRVAHKTVKPKKKDTFTGRLTHDKKALAGEKVVLRERRVHAKAWTTAASATTSSKGRVTFRVVPAHRREQFELVFKGASLYQPSHSAVVTVHVKK